MPAAAFQTGPLRAQTDSTVFHVSPDIYAEKHMKMRVKMGTVVPKMGTFVHPEDVPGDYRAPVAMALHAELGSTHRAIKSAMRWTGASERDREILVRW